MQPDSQRTPDYLVERLAAGDLPAAEARAIRARLEGEPGGPERLAALAADDAATLLRHPPEVVLAEVRRRAEREARLRAERNERRPVAWKLLPVLAVAAAVVVALPFVRRGPEPEGEILKGLAPQLVLHRRTASGAELLGPGASGRAGDLIQIGYVAAGAPYGAIVSIDGAGAVTFHLPSAGAEAALLTSGREVLLPESFRLDDAPAYERFFFVTGARRFPVADVLDAALALAARPDATTAPLALGEGLVQASVLLVKESR
jgi:hypothetical protein